MAPDTARPARVATFVLMGVAYATCEVAAYLDGKPRTFGVVFGIALLAIAIAVSYLIPTPRLGQRPPVKLQLALGAFLGLPIAAEPALREWAGEGFPLELQFVNGLRVLGVALAGVSVWPRLRRLAGVVALFLALFASAMGDQPAIPYLLAAFAVVGGLWLVFGHRAGEATAQATRSAEATDRAALRLPYREAVVFGVLAALALAVVVAGPKRVTLALGELMPTSGGTGETDPFARYGIGDGPEETAGDNAKAAGMVETDTMIEDNKDALVDVVSDMFGPPHRPKKDQERTVAAGLAKVIENHGRLPENRRPNRDFDTSRKGPKSDRTPGSRKARAVFEVEGRTPLHVRAVTYEAYDPDAARWVEGRKPASRAFETEDGDWMKLLHLRGAGDWYAADDRHRLKVADIKDNLVPTPALLTRFRINKVDKPEYYEWDYDGVLTLSGRKRTPTGVVVTTDCRTLDPGRLTDSDFCPTHPLLSAVPPDLKPALDRVAAEWAGHLPRGWPQVDAVLSRLRDGYVLDPRATAPAGHPAPVLWFLEESRRGPDYLFATAAALLLRSLDYPTRVCLGYYAAPDKYDAETDHTPVQVTDLHVWPEVQLRDGHWLVVEPTPGYGVLPPLRPWHERVAETVGNWLLRNAAACVAAVLLLTVLIWKRKRLLDAAFTLAWRTRPGRTWRDVVLGAAKVLERRGRLAGQPRSPSQTLAAWSGELDRAGRADARLAEFVRLAEWAAYAPEFPPPTQEAEVAVVCRQVLDRWTFRNMTPARGPGSGRLNA